MKQTDTYLAEIIDTGMDGEGVARVENVPVFVPYAAKGDLCKIKIEKVNKNYATAKLVKVVRPSEHRETAVCPAYGVCGGCCMQHVAFEYENEYKRDYLKNMLKKSGLDVAVNDTVFDGAFGYRNKLQMPFAEKDGRVFVGFYKRGTHQAVELDDCPLHGEWAKKLIKIITVWANNAPVKAAYNEVTAKGLLRHVVARYVDGFLSVTLVVNGQNLPDAKALYAALKKDFDCNLYISKNTKKTNVILGEEAKLICGEDKTLNIGGVKLNLSPMSFLQVNDAIREKLYAAAAVAVSDCDIIFDVYSGAGILTAALARRVETAKVYGVEIVEDAVVNANGLMWANGLDGRVKNFCGDAAVVLPDLVKRAVDDNKTDVKPRVTVVIDPPRKGCDERVINAIKTSEADKVIYISCNPATLSRDLKLLSDNYDITSATPFNMFPRTAELETLAILTRKPL